jgi:CRISPR/Cas system-associated exonuclease Cas4 (RecB family)
VVRIKKRILSPTAINTYLSCPHKFYLRYIKKLRTKPSIHLIRGQIVHKTLHEFHKNSPGVLPATPIGQIRRELLNIFNNQWAAAENRLNYLELTKEQIDFYHDDSELMLLNFSHWYYKHGMPAPDLTEARILSENFGTMGIIDAVLRMGEEIILVDYKTSKHPRITEDMQRQAALYALLYKDRYGVIPESVWIHFLKLPDDPQPIHIDDELLHYGKILIESVREKTTSQNEKDYTCTCGGYCERDFNNQPKWTESKTSSGY